jgi:putative ABC transport system permease protein
MRFSDTIELAWTNLWRRKARTILTTMGVIIGTAAIITMMALGIGMQRNLTSQFESIGSTKDITVIPEIKVSGSSPFTTGTSSSNILNDDSIDDFRNMEHVELVIPAFTLYADTEIKVGRFTTSVSIVGWNPKISSHNSEEMAEGRFFTKDSGSVMVLGYKIPEIFQDTRHKRDKTPSTKKQRIDTLHKTAKVTVTRVNDSGEKESKTLRVKIVGIVAEKGNTEDYSIYMPMQEVAKLNDWATHQTNTLKMQGYESLKVRVESTDKVDEVVNKITEMGYTAFSFKQMLDQLNQVFVIIQAVLGGIGAIALLVASIGIINTMTMAIYERTKEIGIMKVVGASLKDIRNLFILEAGTIGFMGGVAGIVLSYIVTTCIGFFMEMYISTTGGSTQTQSILYIPPWLVIFAVIFSTFIGLAAGLYPAMKAAKLSALTAIRTE